MFFLQHPCLMFMFAFNVDLLAFRTREPEGDILNFNLDVDTNRAFGKPCEVTSLQRGHTSSLFFGFKFSISYYSSHQLQVFLKIRQASTMKL